MITILAVGKKHNRSIAELLQSYEKRLRQPFLIKWQIIPPSSHKADKARQDESERILKRIKDDDYIILLDERGELLSSPAFCQRIVQPLEQSQHILIIIGGAYGVTAALRNRAKLVWSLSPLVFPHQITRLLLVEQIYRASTIHGGSAYHHQ